MTVRAIAPMGMPRPSGGEGYDLLDLIWAHFRSTHSWPTFDDVDRKLYASGQNFEEVVQQLCPALLRGLSSDISQLPQGTTQLSLTIAGAANVTGASDVLQTFLHMVRTAASIEPHFRPSEPGGQPVLYPPDLRSAAEVEPVRLTKQVMFAAAALGQHEPCFRGGSSNVKELDWSLSYDRGIRPFADTRQLAGYWAIRARVIGQTRSESEQLPFSKHARVLQTHVIRGSVPMPAAPTFGVETLVTAPVPARPAETMSVTCALHPEIEKVAAERYEGGFYYDAVSRAFQAVEHRVQTLIGAHEVGEKLMGIALGKPAPKITVTRSTAGSLESEQTGMQFLFKGAMLALRNPRMHGPDQKDARDEADEMLVFASFLMRRLDIEDEQRKAAASSP